VTWLVLSIRSLRDCTLGAGTERAAGLAGSTARATVWEAEVDARMGAGASLTSGASRSCILMDAGVPEQRRLPSFPQRTQTGRCAIWGLGN
jgi:hypothetical protein